MNSAIDGAILVLGIQAIAFAGWFFIDYIAVKTKAAKDRVNK